MTLSARDFVQRKRGLLTTEVDGEVLAMSIDNGACYGLDRIGTRIWELIAAPTSIEAMCSTLIEEFDVSPETCRQDVTDLLEALLAEGIVSVHPA